MNRPIKVRKIPNIAKSSPINNEQAKSVASREIHMQQARFDFHQVIKRVSTAPNGLRFGAIPPIVS